MFVLFFCNQVTLRIHPHMKSFALHIWLHSMHIRYIELHWVALSYLIIWHIMVRSSASVTKHLSFGHKVRLYRTKYRNASRGYCISSSTELNNLTVLLVHSVFFLVWFWFLSIFFFQFVFYSIFVSFNLCCSFFSRFFPSNSPFFLLWLIRNGIKADIIYTYSNSGSFKLHACCLCHKMLRNVLLENNTYLFKYKVLCLLIETVWVIAKFAHVMMIFGTNLTHAFNIIACRY